MAGEAWDRLPGETAKAYEAAWMYFDAGAQRSLAKIAQRLGKSTPLLERWSKRWDWVERAAGYDSHLAEIELAERRRLAEAQAAVWADREARIRERRYALAEQLLDKAEQMLKTPLVRKRVKGELVCGSCGWKGDGKTLEFPECPKCSSTNLKGGQTVELMPAKWTFDTARKAAVSGAQLADEAITAGAEKEGAELENGAVYEFKNEEYKPPSQ